MDDLRSEFNGLSSRLSTSDPERLTREFLERVEFMLAVELDLARDSNGSVGVARMSCASSKRRTTGLGRGGGQHGTGSDGVVCRISSGTYLMYSGVSGGIT